MSADLVGEPYHCVVCGRRDVRCLCTHCRLDNTTGGNLVAHVADAQREAKRQSKRLTILRRTGISHVSYERLAR